MEPDLIRDTLQFGAVQRLFEQFFVGLLDRSQSILTREAAAAVRQVDPANMSQSVGRQVSVMTNDDALKIILGQELHTHFAWRIGQNLARLPAHNSART